MQNESIATVTQAVRTRRSVRAFLDRDVPRPLIEEVLSLAARSPSGGNLQPWRLYVLANDAMGSFKAMMHERIAQAPEGELPLEYEIYPSNLPEPYRTWRYDIGERMYGAIGVGREDKAGRRRQFARNYEFFGAPVGLLCFIDRGMGPPQWADLGMYLQTVMLLLRERGLNSCAQECWALYHQSIRAFVAAPQEWMLFCGMAVGYVDPTAPINAVESPRMKFDDFARWIAAPA